ncbi:hypothetical protein [Hyphobacterium sp.]|uniref:hypothetical protein n=1 Tax=Hyphobacterium sp. TaxID=2004662 RepID=UPI003748BACA
MSRLGLLVTFIVVIAGIGASCAQAQTENAWSGTIRVQYSATSVEGDMIASVGLPDRAGLAVACSSSSRDFSPCQAEVWGNLERPPDHARYIVVRVFKDGERIMSNVVRRNDIWSRSNLIGFRWDMAAGAAANYWLVLAEGGELTVQFLDANGLGEPIAYADYTFDVAPLPTRAIETVQLMRASNLRPRQWAIEILGRCAREIENGPAIVEVEVTGRNFQREECRP